MSLSIKSILLSFFIASFCFADNFKGLGGHQDLFDQAQDFQGEQNVSVVESRRVSLDSRVEISPEATLQFGGDPYLITQGWGFNLGFHFNPRWSIHAKHTQFQNKISSEAQSLIETFNLVPDLDWPKYQTLGFINFSPIYGKFNFLNLTTVQFDVYAALGGGQIQLESGSSTVLSAGAGMGIWWHPRWVTRFELRYETYKVQRTLGQSKVEPTKLGLGLGVLL